MKRVIAIALLVGLILGAVSGFAYASGAHEVLKGNKLVGYGPLDEAAGTDTVFRITNPDCYADIEIKEICILNKGGVEVYRGQIKTAEGEEMDPVLKPHQFRMISLELYSDDEGVHTIEIEWRANKSRACDLAGWTTYMVQPPVGPMHVYALPMENMYQELPWYYRR